MEKKTIEKMRTAVLAECERLCPNVGDFSRVRLLGIGKIERTSEIGFDPHYDGKIWAIFSHGGGKILYFIHEDSDEAIIDFAYMLFGFAERDAVAEKEAEIAALKAENKRLKNREFKQSRYFGYIKAENERLREFVEFCKKSPEKLVTTHFFENGEFDYCDLVPLQDAAELALSPAPVTEGKKCPICDGTGKLIGIDRQMNCDCVSPKNEY